MAGSYATTFFTAAAMGVLSHLATLGVLWDFKIWLLLKSYVTGLGALLLAFMITLGYGPLSAIAMTIYAAISFNTGVISSMLIYRLFFHRLRKFPGPFWAKITRFYAVYISAKRMQYFLDLRKLHKTYGDFVRTGKILLYHVDDKSNIECSGPRDLSILRPSAVQAIYGLQSTCVKSNWYGEPTDKRKSLQTTRNPEVHKRRRKTWDQAFSAKGMLAA
jgi:hypothetical protein